MKSYEELYEIVKQKLPEKRFYHSVCVVERAEEYAKIYNQNVEEAKLIAICHDIAKCLNDSQIKQLVEKYNIKLDKMEEKSQNLSHSKVGAYIAKYEFGLSEEMCSAISFHTTGKEDMTIMEKIIFLADCTGEDRHFEKVEEIYKTAKTDLDKAMINCLKETIKQIVEDNNQIHINTIKAYNFLIKNKK